VVDFDNTSAKDYSAMKAKQPDIQDGILFFPACYGMVQAFESVLEIGFITPVLF
jgi:hypothetical protein